jgi:uncharacterized membrane protein YdjX (TVP38/TMEM64 family)
MPRVIAGLEGPWLASSTEKLNIVSANRYKIPELDHASERSARRWTRRVGLTLWAVLLAAGVYLYVFRHEWLKQELSTLSGSSPLWVGGVYLALGCARGFTLVPATYLLLAGMLVLSPLPLYALTIAGILVSSTAVYYFADTMGLARFFERNHAAQVAKLRALMQRRELPIVIAWSFFPIAPTDLVCYVCGALHVDVKKCLVGVVIFLLLDTHRKIIISMEYTCFFEEARLG